MALKIEDLILQVVDNPTQELKDLYEITVHQTEYQLLQQSQEFPPKSQEWFDKRKEAFAYRRECAMKMISAWVSKYGTTEECVVKYADTLMVPFQTIKKPTH